MSSLHSPKGPADAIEQFNLGNSYANGENAPQDDTLAAFWYRKAAEQGLAVAKCNLGVCYLYGKGVPISAYVAADWFLKAAMQGEVTAQYNLGILYSSGTGVKKHLGAAAAWFLKASDQGYGNAKIKLGHLLDSGVKPASPELCEAIDPSALNVDFKKELQTRKALFPRNSPEPEAPKVKVTPCPTCGVKIASHILKKHQIEYHPPGPKPKTNLHLPRQPKTQIKKSTCPDLPAQPVLNGAPAIKSGAPESLCPRCGGDGGVRGGCRKCDGTGWVPKEMERDLVYRPDQHVAENSRISNSDYVGGNDGAHFREMDGRIGTIPMFDDYGEES
ncbi:tetratricopeptide repeat protein (plasmid) [Pseudomonas silesiensis]|uniref:tetratricopeptide repeat protein n=1 Tax=Pseudomonas silesiensis TaxID=1853130 RepID=UPI0030CCAB87